MINTKYMSLDSKVYDSKGQINSASKNDQIKGVQTKELSAQKNATYTVSASSSTLQVGSRGAAVTELQKNLTKLGYDSNEVKKKRIRTGVLCFALIFLSACAAPENGGKREQELDFVLPESQSFSTSFETMPEETISDISQETTSKSDEELVFSEEKDVTEPETSLALYQKTVEESNKDMVFSLIYLDGDEIPELVAGDRGNDRYFIYTIKDDTVLCLVDSMTTAELTYFEGSGIIAAFASWNGGGDEGGYGRQFYQTFPDRTLTDDEIPLLSYSYNAIYDENGIYMGKGITNYFYMGRETDESTYDEILKSLEITDEGGRLCLENAVFAEEMLNALK